MTRPLLRAVVFTAMLAVLIVPAFSRNSVSTGIGVNTFNYDSPTYLNLQAAYQHELDEALELYFGADFSIATEEGADGNTEPRFIVPVNMGLNFTFPGDPMTYLFGVGLVPTFKFDPGTDRDFTFLMGPYAKAEVRFKVHPIMSIFLSVHQDLPIGRPNWINTGTRGTVGINFGLGE